MRRRSATVPNDFSGSGRRQPRSEFLLMNVMTTHGGGTRDYIEGSARYSALCVLTPPRNHFALAKANLCHRVKRRPEQKLPRGCAGSGKTHLLSDRSPAYNFRKAGRTNPAQDCAARAALTNRCACFRTKPLQASLRPMPYASDLNPPTIPT